MRAAAEDTEVTGNRSTSTRAQTQQAENGNGTRAGNIPALERATGRSWEQWLEIFTAQNAKEQDHATIARIARAEMPDDLHNPDWWAQGTAIAYEQHAGLRVPGQSSDGTFRVSASRTLPLDRDAALAAWVDAHGDRSEHLGHASGEVRTSRTDKRSFWRCSLDGAGRIEVATVEKDSDRATITVGQEGLPTGERIEEWRTHWKTLLAAL